MGVNPRRDPSGSDGTGSDRSPAPAPAAPGRAPAGRRAGLLLGVALGLVGLGLVVRTLVVHASDVEQAVSTGNPVWLVGAFVVAAMAMVAMALPWHRAIGLLGGRLTLPDTVARYFSGEIGKYVPGSVWAVVGRGELARRAGVGPPAAYGSVGLSLAALYLAALATATVTLPAVAAGGGDRRYWLLLLVLPLGLLALHHAVIERVVQAAGRISRRTIDVPVPRWGQVVSLVALYLPTWVLISTATWITCRALGGDSSWPQIAFATALSWFAGFAAVPVPGGVGVREAVFVASTPSLEAGVAAAVALVARLLFVAVDGAAAVAASVWLAQHARSRGLTTGDVTERPPSSTEAG